MSLAQLALVALIAFVASFYSVVGGGGGILLIPGLMVVGLPGPTAVATSRLGALGLGLAGTVRFQQAGMFPGRSAWPILATTSAGAAAGAVLLLRADPQGFERVFALLTILLGPYLAFRKQAAPQPADTPDSRRRRLVGYPLAFAIGVYAAVFGAAWAIFFITVMVGVFGRSLMQSAALRAFAGLGVGLVSSAVFGLGGAIDAAPAAVTFLAMAAGSYLGASFSLKRGEGYARYVTAIVAVVAGLKLLFW